VLLFEEYINLKKSSLLPKLFFSEYFYVFSDLEGLGPIFEIKKNNCKEKKMFCKI